MSFKREVIEKLGKVQDTQSTHTTELAVYNQILKEHVRRTDLAEKSIELIRERVVPIEHHVLFINKMGKWIVSAVAVIASLAGVYSYLFK